ncbi:MAG: MGMT family protein [Thermoplasmata archaeon]|nr:MGMT family protein [Thermoplasmata archaeon]
MGKRKRTFREKLRDNRELPKIVHATKEMGGKWGVEEGDTILIPAPAEVDEIMKQVPEGKVITIDMIRDILARKHGTTISCPLTTGIFASIAAHASEEERMAGAKQITPYWRTLKKDGEINPKYPGGTDAQKKLLEKEGHRFVNRGNRVFVVDYEKKLVEL